MKSNLEGMRSAVQYSTSNQQLYPNIRIKGLDPGLEYQYQNSEGSICGLFEMPAHLSQLASVRRDHYYP